MGRACVCVLATVELRLQLYIVFKNSRIKNSLTTRGQCAVVAPAGCGSGQHAGHGLQQRQPGGLAALPPIRCRETFASSIA